MAWTDSDLTAIEDALKRGVKRVKYADKEIEYGSVEELKQIRDMIRQSLGKTKADGRIYANFSKGL